MDDLELLRMRDEVLPALYWMNAEGLTSAPSSMELARFLAISQEALDPWLGEFVARGWLEAGEGRFRLTAAGEELGKRAFAEDFSDMTGSTHGECDESCWCHSSPDEARRCLEERVGHVH
ncbi:MAG: hypothetical protein AVDCRST_MAG69-80 [uncultured Solirubrobacteraceae bacterium]|uniref:HTH marR-type domain-containing protein n=1 Tax=uncultured Solirubrobacteraceae bacterium TaxID=1162706 RepID=A0A6J4RNM0_9ACTN|nr:MAG: hypothetical protein AVDCRST_MAG69-80 [uncultured Solirubrobacteraceae bacterium]